jgi:hypothetical protein
MKSVTSFFFLASCMLFSCKSLHRTTEAPENSGTQLTIKEERITTPPAKVSVRVGVKDTLSFAYLVSFYSPGDGIDAQGAQAFEAFLQHEQKESAEKISYIRVPWGREGERDYCIRLNGLSDTEATAFAEAMNKVLRQAQKVNVLKDQPCRYLKPE